MVALLLGTNPAECGRKAGISQVQVSRLEKKILDTLKASWTGSGRSVVQGVKITINGSALLFFEPLKTT